MPYRCAQDGVADIAARAAPSWPTMDKGFVVVVILSGIRTPGAVRFLVRSRAACKLA